MAIKILTIEEMETTRTCVISFGECIEVVVGKAIQDYVCDNSGIPIPAGTDCAAVMILPFKDHPNYEHQKNMLGQYLEVVP